MAIPVQRPPLNPMQIDANLLANWYQAIRAPGSAVAAPANSSAPGVAGQYAHDNSYFYVCVKTNTQSGANQWLRVPLANF